ncbi:MAG: UDP-N-acetylmuramoyl-L-alanine--D-glutamate ligase, partial [Candidatus Desulfobacillus denitrificans]
MSWQGKTVLVLGLGESGLAMVQWLVRQGARVRVADSRTEPPFAAELKRSAPGARLLAGSFNDALLDGVGLIGLSPGLALNEPVVAEAARRGIPVVGEIELFAGALRALGARDR